MKYLSTVLAVTLVTISPVFGHHSDVALDLNSVVTFEGTVTEFSLRNPHTYFTVATTDENGIELEWTIQMASAITVSRRGWSRDSLSVGDQVSIGAHPARDGRSYGMLEWIERDDGVPLTYSIGSGSRRTADPGPVPTTSTLEGRWIVDRSSLVNYPGGLDQLMIRDLSLTEKGKVAEAAYSQDSEENPELSCITKPTPGMIVYTDLYPLEIKFNETEKTITTRSQYFDQERTVYMDGRTHPNAETRFHEGHSIGQWENNVLVIDTRNFLDHRSPYQNGIPSGAQKHVTERYQLSENGTRMAVEFVLEDPEYILGSMTHKRQLIYSPQLDMSPFNCDLEATRRYLPPQP